MVTLQKIIKFVQILIYLAIWKTYTLISKWVKATFIH